MGDNMDNTIANLNHLISIEERKNLNLTGVKKIESFDSETFLLETVMGYLIIKGEELEIVKLDTFQGNVQIKGKINSITYVEGSKKKDKEDSVFNRLFK